MKKQIAKLIDVKSIATICITIALIYGFFKGLINGEQFMTVAVMVYTFYFARKKGE